MPARPAAGREGRCRGSTQPSPGEARGRSPRALLAAALVAAGLDGRGRRGGRIHDPGWASCASRPTASLPPLLAASSLVALAARRVAGPHAEEAWRSLRARLDALAPGLAVLLVVVVATALSYSSRVAAGSDAYGYVSQAELWMKGQPRPARSPRVHAGHALLAAPLRAPRLPGGRGRARSSRSTRPGCRWRWPRPGWRSDRRRSTSSYRLCGGLLVGLAYVHRAAARGPVRRPRDGGPRRRASVVPAPVAPADERRAGRRRLDGRARLRLPGGGPGRRSPRASRHPRAS